MNPDDNTPPQRPEDMPENVIKPELDEAEEAQTVDAPVPAQESTVEAEPETSPEPVAPALAPVETASAPETPSVPSLFEDGPEAEAKTAPKAAGKSWKETIKRLGVVMAGLYGFLLVLPVLWAFTLAGRNLGLFRFLGGQASLDAALMNLFNVLMVIAMTVLLLGALGMFFRLITLKKDADAVKQKTLKKRSIGGGLLFLLSLTLWVVGLIFLSPRLNPGSSSQSLIRTTPEVTIGLTAPVNISFDASGIPVDTKVYRVLSYTWNFGDGSTGNGPTVSHRYTQKGSADGLYTVSLNMIVENLTTGEQIQQEFTVDVSIENEQVLAAFTATPSSGEVPLEVEFDASASRDPDGQIVAYEWDFDGDNRFDDAEGVRVTHTFTQEGDFEVKLRVTDNNGEFNTTSQFIESGSIGGLRAVITSEDAQSDELYRTGESYDFNGNLSQIDEGNIVKYTWDFGDGTTEVGRKIAHIYQKAGTYEIVLAVQDADGNIDESTLEIRVIEQGTPPQANFVTTPSAQAGSVSGPVPLTINFDARSSVDPEDDIVDYEWDFDSNGSIDASGSRASYTYSEIGSFEATLIVTDSSGNQDDMILPIVVTEQGIQASLEVSQVSGEVPLTIDFDASASSFNEGSIVSYEWDFGDGSKPYIGSPILSYKYTSVGTYTAKVTVLGSDGSRSTATQQVVVRPVALTACFTVNTDSGSAPLFVSVDPSCSKGTIQSYEWNFGDGEISFDRKPATHTYSDAGTYTIQLEVTGESGIVDRFENEITVRSSAQ